MIPSRIKRRRIASDWQVVSLTWALLCESWPGWWWDDDDDDNEARSVYTLQSSPSSYLCTLHKTCLLCVLAVGVSRRTKHKSMNSQNTRNPWGHYLCKYIMVLHICSTCKRQCVRRIPNYYMMKICRGRSYLKQEVCKLSCCSTLALLIGRQVGESMDDNGPGLNRPLLLGRLW